MITSMKFFCCISYVIGQIETLYYVVDTTAHSNYYHRYFDDTFSGVLLSRIVIPIYPQLIILLILKEIMD